jgi:hypothetical protein
MSDVLYKHSLTGVVSGFKVLVVYAVCTTGGFVKSDPSHGIRPLLYTTHNTLHPKASGIQGNVSNAASPNPCRFSESTPLLGIRPRRCGARTSSPTVICASPAAWVDKLTREAQTGPTTRPQHLAASSAIRAGRGLHWEAERAWPRSKLTIFTHRRRDTTAAAAGDRQGGSDGP